MFFFAGIYPLKCGANLEDQFLSGLNIDIPWYTTEMGMFKSKRPCNDDESTRFPRDLIPGENDRSDPQRLSQCLWFGGLGNYFPFWDGLFFWGGYPFWVFSGTTLAQNRMNFQVLRKTSGRSLGANFSCYIWRGVPYKEEGHSLLWKTGWKWLRGLATAVAVAVVGTHLTSN